MARTRSEGVSLWAAPVRHFDLWMASHPLAYATLLVVAMVAVLLLFVDLPLAIYLRESNFILLRDPLNAIGDLGAAEGWVAGAILLYILTLWQRRPGSRLLRRHGAPGLRAWICWVGRYCLLLLASLAVTGAIIHLIKALVGRSRPNVFFSDGVYVFGRVAEGWPMESFPSGHTQVAMTVAAVLALAFPALRTAVFVIAGLIAFSRLVTGAHYLSDVVASTFICLVVVQALAAVLLDRRRTWLDLPPQLWPKAWGRHRRRRRSAKSACQPEATAATLSPEPTASDREG
ncbi:MAG: hypothetical protein Kilf2KO_48360 [Rhodospirillales bacterium]